MGLFAKAAAKKESAPKAAKKSTTWAVGDPQGDKVGLSVKELVRISGEMKALEAKKSLHSQVVSKHANASFIRDFAEAGVMPETPMKVVNADGDSVTFVVQDRGSQYALKDEQVEALEAVLGEDVVAGLVYDETTIQFNRSVMAVPGVSEALEAALEKAISGLVKKGVLDADAADELVEAKVKRALKPGTLDRAASLVGNDQTRLAAFIDAMGSGCTKYIKT